MSRTGATAAATDRVSAEREGLSGCDLSGVFILLYTERFRFYGVFTCIPGVAVYVCFSTVGSNSDPTRETQRHQAVPWPRKERMMADLYYLGGTLLFFGVTWLFVKLCDRV